MVSFEGELPIGAQAPSHVVLEVTYSEPGVRGDTATNTLKPATVETGATVMVPLFVETGEKIKIDKNHPPWNEKHIGHDINPEIKSKIGAITGILLSPNFFKLFLNPEKIELKTIIFISP
jgi:hypothetical protein